MIATRSTPRVLKVGEEMKRVLARYFQMGQLGNLDLARAMVTISEVRMSPDLRLAKVYVTSLNMMDPTLLLEWLAREKPLLRKFIAHEMRLKYVPELTFRMDESGDYAQRIEKILHEPKVQRDIMRHDVEE